LTSAGAAAASEGGASAAGVASIAEGASASVVEPPLFSSAEVASVAAVGVSAAGASVSDTGSAGSETLSDDAIAVSGDGSAASFCVGDVSLGDGCSSATSGVALSEGAGGSLVAV
jgi:hypothetical protein